MHDNSLRLMRDLLVIHANSAGPVLDIGSQDINGTYRDLVASLGLHGYTGIDIAAGPNVDLVVSEHDWSQVAPAPLVISGQCAEHTKRPWEWMKLVESILLPGGILIVIAPWRWEIHRFPIDCWRILPDGMESLFEYAGLTTIVTGVDGDDCFGVAGK